MLLTEMFIKEQGQDAAIIFGRFNPPHQGHVAAWKEAAKSPIWYVGTNQSDANRIAMAWLRQNPGRAKKK